METPLTPLDFARRTLAKLGLRDRVQVVVLAYEAGLVGRAAP